jgi:hypothetical protein
MERERPIAGEPFQELAEDFREPAAESREPGGPLGESADDFPEPDRDFREPDRDFREPDRDFREPAEESQEPAGRFRALGGRTPATGEPRVDAALARLDELAGRPVTEHRVIFEDVHRRLREVLGELDTRQPPQAPDAAGTVSRPGR